MHRQLLLAKLATHQPFDDTERCMLQTMQQFVEAHTDCFERSLQIGHVTGSAWIMDRNKTHVLLTHHRKLDRWLQLGGHADGDPDILRVALREAQEESGLQGIIPIAEFIFDVDIHTIPARGHEPDHLHYDVRFLLQADRRQPCIQSGESKALAWVEIDKLARLCSDESMLRMVTKSLK